jgi:hypothetical protein
VYYGPALYFEILFDGDQAELGGLPIFGSPPCSLHARLQSAARGPNLEELAGRGREAVIGYLSELCELFRWGRLP